MASPVHIPRVNNNDDTVRMVELLCKAGQFVKAGEILGSVETDKAVIDVVADCDGHVLKVLHEPGATANVGSILLWLGASPHEPVPDEAPPSASPAGTAHRGRPTSKAQEMLKELHVDADQIPASGERLTVADIQSWLAAGGRRAAGPGGATPRAVETMPDVPGKMQDLGAEAHGMLMTVQWHRDCAVHAYLEMEYDPAPWDDYAATWAREQKLMLSPLMPLLAWRLVELAKTMPRINATIVNNRLYQYRPVNLGFTVQADSTLYLTVVRDAHQMDATRFIDAMGTLQRNAMAHKLRASETSGATLAFSSMARWKVSRHIPILPPFTSLMVAHAAPRDTGKAVLGASYDHRLLSGFDVTQVLQAMIKPPARRQEAAIETGQG
jgi:pyruvate/2-oxoglutarate dehydrogenase complex dihydrolipoamide acyltransferase (E2) component